MPTKFRVSLSRAAERDFDDVWEFISQDDREAAVRFVLQLEERVSTLETFPERCPLLPENDLLSTQHRHLIYGDYRIIFRIKGRVVYVVRVLHSARLLDATALENQ